MQILNDALNNLATNSPYICLVAIFMILFYLMYKSSIKTMKEVYNLTLKEMQQSHQQAFDEMRKTVKLLSDRLNKETEAIKKEPKEKSKK